VLIVVSAGIYVGKAWSQFNQLDLVRMFIPPAAFVLWTMLTPDSAFDAAFPGDVPEARREVLAIALAFLVGVVAKKLGDREDKAPKQTTRTFLRG
jgi:hypothetical protein